MSLINHYKKFTRSLRSGKLLKFSQLEHYDYKTTDEKDVYTGALTLIQFSWLGVYLLSSIRFKYRFKCRQ